MHKVTAVDFIMPKHKSKKRHRSSSGSGSSDSRRDKSNRRRRDSSYGRRDSPQSQALNVILRRLNAIENSLSVSSTISAPSCPPRECHTPPLQPLTSGLVTDHTMFGATAERTTPASGGSSRDATDRIVGALTSLFKVRSNQYYISSFDPSIHDFDVWCAEVDVGRDINHWDDRECLSRIGGCLRGDARTWLNEWVTSDRTWTNFKTEFRSLCPRNIDIANILFDVMCTDSKSFVTYAEYARKSLLRLNIVTGLSDDLKTAIVIRGISDPQVKAAALNAKLQPNQLVEFLSVYTKPKTDFRNTRNPTRSSNNDISRYNNQERDISKPHLKCFNCDGIGHKKDSCPKKKCSFLETEVFGQGHNLGSGTAES